MLRSADAGCAETRRCRARVVKVRSYTARRIELPLVEGYRITGKTINVATNFLVTIIADNGFSGIGCAAPSGDVTGESNEMCEAALDGALADLVAGIEVPADPSSIALDASSLVPECPAARAAVDIALWDLASKRANEPLVRYWGGNPIPVPTSVTIGICDVQQTLKEAGSWLERGYRVLKVKIGEDLDVDLQRLRSLRELTGPGCLIRVDANQGYDLEGARRLLRDSADLNIEMFEQPLAQDDLDGLAELTAGSNVPVIADEAAGTIAECQEIVDRQAAHGINIKLMKCGGPSAAKIIHDYAHARGLSLMLGCNDETRISIAAAVHLAQSMPGLRYADLDGHMDIAEDPAAGGFEIRDGLMHLLDRPGLGVELTE